MHNDSIIARFKKSPNSLGKEKPYPSGKRFFPVVAMMNEG